LISDAYPALIHGGSLAIHNDMDCEASGFCVAMTVALAAAGSPRRSTAHCVGKCRPNHPHPNPSPVSGDGTWGIVACRKIGKLDASGIKACLLGGPRDIEPARMVGADENFRPSPRPALFPEPGALLAPDPSGTRRSPA
jgi:hypothetical protein